MFFYKLNMNKFFLYYSTKNIIPKSQLYKTISAL